MAACLACTVCDRPATRAAAADAASIPCNVRRFAGESFTVWRCAGCGSLHCAEDADLPRYYADYPLRRQRLTLHERIGYRHRRRWLTQRGVGAGARILDYGCGAGLFVDWLRGHGHPDAAGYDAFAPAYADPRVLEPAAYDAVVSYDVIEHDDDPRRFLGDLAALVRPGGVLAIGTPNADHL